MSLTWQLVLTSLTAVVAGGGFVAWSVYRFDKEFPHVRSSAGPTDGRKSGRVEAAE